MSKFELKDIADKMVQLRKERGLSVFEVAAAIGLDPVRLKAIEDCEKEPTKVLDALADYYGISIGDFFGESQSVPQELADIGVKAISYNEDYKGEREMTPEKIEEYKDVIAKIKEEHGIE